MDVQKKGMKFVMRYAKSILHITQKTKSEERKGARKELSATILEAEKLKQQESSKINLYKLSAILLDKAQIYLSSAQDAYDFGFVNGLNTAAQVVAEYGKERC